MITKKILGIETSCDDTSLAIIEKIDQDCKLIYHESFSQEHIMAKWGGVVPEIAARNHSEKIIHLFKDALETTKINPQDLHAIGVTSHPGLLGPLLTGVNLAKTLSLAYKTPIIPVNHLYAHLEAIHLTHPVTYPYLGVLVSGGHTSFFKVSSSEDFIYLGGTIDDAAGEAFDKGGKLMGLPYPAGKTIDEMSKKGDPLKYSFPIGLRHKKIPGLSYSGLKTALRVFIEKQPHILEDKKELNNLAASYQEAIVQALKEKLAYALPHSSLPIVVGGGVACNSRLRLVLQESYQDVYFVAPQFCTDNGAMIANYAARNLHQKITYPETLNLDAKSRFLKRSSP